MKKIALIKNGVVDNVIVIGEEFSPAPYAGFELVDVTDTFCGPGMVYENGEFIEASE